MEEVRNALFSLHPTKAPGTERLHPIFFQKFWETTKLSILQLAQDALKNKEIWEGIGRSIISLIPKVPNPENINHLRPISLCNTAYKVITKILVNRLRPVMEDLLAPFQTSFIPGRRVSDNFIISQEIIHSYTTRNGRKGSRAIKVDLNKAFD